MKNTSHPGLLRRAAVTLGAIALAFGATAVAAPAASAAPGNMPVTDGSLTIHKFVQPSPAGGANNNGTAITVPAGWVALQGVNFDIQRITNIDLTTDAGWTTATGYAGNPALATSLGAATSVVTGADGTIARTLPIGAYLVTERPSPAATIVPSGAPANITMTAAPFVVTVPVPTGNGTWNSNVHVYPKNSVTTVQKTVNDPGPVGLGSKLTWSVTAKVPTLTSGQSISQFAIRDVLDAKVTYVPGSATLTVNGTAVGFTDGTTGQNGLWTATAAGRTVLQNNQGATVTLTFDTTVIATGAILNKADVFVNDPTFTSPIVTNPVTSYWGPVEILKHATGDVTKTLAGAKFTVHSSQADAAAGTNPITVSGATEFTTGAAGTVLIPGLFIGNTDTSTRTYWLRETVAPAGYLAVTTPIRVDLTAVGATAPVRVTVPNPQQPTITLPLTGANGTLLLTLLGAGILLVGAGSALVYVRRSNGAKA